MDDLDLKELTIEYLKETPVGEELEKAFALYENAQQAALVLNNLDDPEDLTLTRIGTVLSLNLFGTLLGGKKPKDLTQEDWENIAKEVVDKAVLTEDQDYSIYVFDLYAEYIDTSANVLSKRASNEKQTERVEAIKALASELRNNKEQLQNGKIEETAYIEKCMWVSLEAMIKCMATYIGFFTKEEIGDFVLATSSFAFEYARLKLYQKEQALLNEYLENQKILDDQLQVKFEAIKKEIQEESEHFLALVDNAFDPDFRAALTGSIDLAREAGVSEEEILHSVEDIDSFFLD